MFGARSLNMFDWEPSKKSEFYSFSLANGPYDLVFASSKKDKKDEDTVSQPSLF